MAVAPGNVNISLPWFFLSVLWVVRKIRVRDLSNEFGILGYVCYNSGNVRNMNNVYDIIFQTTIFLDLKFFKPLLEPISKIRLGFRARRETVKKRSIHAHVVCEHFEPFCNTAMGT